MTVPATPGRRGNLDGIPETIAEGLQHLGLTAYEIRVYQAILKHPRSRVPEIARFSKVPQPKVYSTIKRLIERGLCESHLGPINQYSVLDPEDAFAPLLDFTAQRQSDATMAISALQKLHNESSQGLSRREGRLKMFQGKPAANRNFKFLVSTAESYIDIVARLPLVAQDDDDTIHEKLEQGIAVRMLCELNGPMADADRESLTKSKANGAQIRTIDKVPMRLGIFDNKITILPMVDPAAGQGDGFVMLEIRNTGLSESFRNVYELLWALGKDF